MWLCHILNFSVIAFHRTLHFVGLKLVHCIPALWKSDSFLSSLFSSLFVFLSAHLVFRLFAYSFCKILIRLIMYQRTTLRKQFAIKIFSMEQWHSVLLPEKHKHGLSSPKDTVRVFICACLSVCLSRWKLINCWLTSHLILGVKTEVFWWCRHKIKQEESESWPVGR